jgi:hypothetical protein
MPLVCQRIFWGLPVERVDLGGDGGVLVGDDLVGDPGVDQSHRHLLVAEKGCDGLESHAVVELVGSGLRTMLNGLA